ALHSRHTTLFRSRHRRQRRHERNDRRYRRRGRQQPLAASPKQSAHERSAAALRRPSARAFARLRGIAQRPRARLGYPRAMRVPGRLAIPVVVVLLALAAWWAWSAHEARSQQRAIAALVTEASAEMRNWLEATPTQEHVIAAESRLEALADMRTSQREEFARAAELYLVGARALAQRQVDAARLAAQAQASERALAAHMAGAARRSPGWIREATEL